MATLTRGPVVTAEHVAQALGDPEACVIARGKWFHNVHVVPHAEFDAMVDAIVLVDADTLRSLEARGIDTAEAMAEAIMRNA